MKENEVQELERQIRHHNELYWDKHAPEISDYEYDKLVVRLKELAPDSPVLLEMGPKDRGIGAPFRHKAPMLSLDKCYSNEEILEWARSFSGPIVAMPKYDGIACALHYDATGRLVMAATRGDGQVGDDITDNAREIKEIPARIPAPGHPVEIRGEIYMRLSVFARFKDQGMANPRNLTAGAVKQKDKKKVAAYELSFAAYDLLGGDETTQREELAKLAAFGFAKIDSLVLERDAVVSGFEEFAKWRPTLDYEIDGVVFKADSVAEQRRLGETSHHPRYAMAYKFQGDSGVSTLRTVEWSVARTGVITPVAIVDPVTLSGVTVTRASLHHVGYVAKLGLTLGAQLTLVRRGGVIPHVEGVVAAGAEPVPVPTACPSCGAPVIREKDFLYCTAPETCSRAVIGRLAHFASTLDMLGFGDVLLEQAYAAGLLRSLPDFYRLKWQDLEKLERCGEKLAKKLVAEVDKKRTLDLATFLRALGIAELGKHVSAILAARYRTLDAVLGATEEELAATHSIGETIAKSVVSGLRDMRPTIEALREHVTLTHAGDADAKEGPLSGKSFVFTGKMVALARSDAEKRVRALGGDVLSAVNKTLTYLVVGANKSDGKSTKEKAADKLVAAGAPVQIIEESQLLGMLEGASAEPGPATAPPGEPAPAAKKQMKLF